MPGSRSIVVHRTFAAAQERLFEAWCHPELMAQWFFPAPGWRAEVVAEVRVGGRYRVAMYDPAGGAHVQEGVYREIVPPSRLVFTWSCVDLGVVESLVTLEFAEKGGATELTLTHQLPDDPAILREHEEGWNGCLDSLSRYLEIGKESVVMNTIKEKLIVRGSTAKVFSAITEQAGYNGWWSKDCRIGQKAGDESSLKFNKEGNIVSMRFRIDEIVPNRSVRWTCTAHDMPSWLETTLRWDLAADVGRTEVSFEHGGWKGEPPEPVVQGWRHFLGSLRSFVEVGQGQPW